MYIHIMLIVSLIDVDGANLLCAATVLAQTFRRNQLAVRHAFFLFIMV
jgi:hypothetical protein